jgi:dihydropteroate synthase
VSGKVQVWGVVNVTPDSFSDGGKYLNPGVALSHARSLLADGADVIDVGAESTRPGATRISVAEEIDRLSPVVGALVTEGHRVSVDTMNAETAVAMLGLGVPIINDVSGGLADPDMLGVVADSGVTYVMMHWRGHSDTMDQHATYNSVVAEVVEHLRGRIQAAIDAGIDKARIVVDPGFGFSKTPEHNWDLIRGISDLVELGFPVLAGVSRKRFIGGLFSGDHEMSDRDDPSAMVGALLAKKGVSALRVHNVASQLRALEIMGRAEGGVRV